MKDSSLHFKPLEIEDAERLIPFLVDYRPETTEGNFATLFQWRRHFHFQWCIWEKTLLITGLDSSGFFGLMPFGPSRVQCVERLFSWLNSQSDHPRLLWVDERLKEELERLANWNFSPRRDNFDYVYRRDDLVHLPGKDYQSKRNHVSRFNRDHPGSRFEILSGENVPRCVALAEEWSQKRGVSEGSFAAEELISVKEALHHLKTLRLVGGIIWLDEKIEAFTLGSRLNDDTALIHIEKADPEIPGLYAAINQAFCAEVWKDVQWINREDDLGMPGLRKAKLSYHPTRLVHKYTLTQKH